MQKNNEMAWEMAVEEGGEGACSEALCVERGKIPSVPEVRNHLLILLFVPPQTMVMPRCTQSWKLALPVRQPGRSVKVVVP